nr:hypothetical protein [Tanacetum cinerariifolium]
MDDTDDEPEDQELKAHYMYMEKIQKVTPDDANNSRPIFNVELLQKVVDPFDVASYDGCARDENPIRTLGDYSKPSHEGYRNNIEPPEGNNVNKPPKDGDRACQAKIKIIDPDGEEFTKTFQSISTSRKLFEKENPREIIDLDHFHDKLYLMRRSLEILRKFHLMILRGRFNQLSHVSSFLLSKPGEY